MIRLIGFNIQDIQIHVNIQLTSTATVRNLQRLEGVL
jgi:hypothetical protein